MLSRGTWLFSVLVLYISVCAEAMRPLFRFAARRAPVAKRLARTFSGVLFSAKDEAVSKTGAKDILVSSRGTRINMESAEEV